MNREKRKKKESIEVLGISISCMKCKAVRMMCTTARTLPASSFRLDSGKGTMRRQRITARMWHKVTLSFQSFFKVFTQISPLLETFGW